MSRCSEILSKFEAFNEASIAAEVGRVATRLEKKFSELSSGHRVDSPEGFTATWPLEADKNTALFVNAIFADKSSPASKNPKFIYTVWWQKGKKLLKKSSSFNSQEEVEASVSSFIESL